MEAARARLELCSLDIEEVESLDVDDVEAAAAIHQYLRESGVENDGVHDERIDAKAMTLSRWSSQSKVMGVLDQLRYCGTAILAVKTSRCSLLRCREVSYVEGPP